MLGAWCSRFKKAAERVVFESGQVRHKEGGHLVTTHDLVAYFHLANTLDATTATAGIDVARSTGLELIRQVAAEITSD